MKAISKSLFFFIAVGFITSCQKDFPLDATFQGSVKYQCDGSPVKGVKVEIWRHFDTGREQSSHVGDAITDVNGHYQLNASVERKGSFRYYELQTTGNISPRPDYFIITDFEKMCYTGNNNDNVYIDIEIPAYQVINFHIKNVNPYDLNDRFDGLNGILFKDSITYVQSISLGGMQVDTIVKGYGAQQTPFRFGYYVRKNGVQSFFEDSIPVTCFDVPIVDIFY